MKTKTKNVSFPYGKILIGAIAIVLLLSPSFGLGSYGINVIVTCLVFASLGICWNLISGYAGQISWCHAAFLSVGGYTSIIFYQTFGWSPIFSLPIGMLISLVVATIIGNMTFRLRGTYFSIATIALSEIVRVILLFFRDITGGSLGIYVPYKVNQQFNLVFLNNTPFLYIMFGVLAVILLIANVFDHARIGYSLRAIKGDEDAAFSLGVSTFSSKLRAFQLSAMLTAAVGTIYAFFLTFIDPAGFCGLDMSVRIGMVAIIGGVGTLWGPVLGAFIVIPLIELAGTLMGQMGGTQLFYGVALVLVVMFKPDGLISFFKRKKDFDETVPETVEVLE